MNYDCKHQNSFDPKGKGKTIVLTPPAPTTLQKLQKYQSILQGTHLRAETTAATYVLSSRACDFTRGPSHSALPPMTPFIRRLSPFLLAGLATTLCAADEVQQLPAMAINGAAGTLSLQPSLVAPAGHGRSFHRPRRRSPLLRRLFGQ